MLDIGQLEFGCGPGTVEVVRLGMEDATAALTVSAVWTQSWLKHSQWGRAVSPVSSRLQMHS